MKVISEYDQSGEHKQKMHQQRYAAAPKIERDAEQRIYEKEKE